MLVGIIWNGTGIACILLLFLSFKKVQRELHNDTIKRIVSTVLCGVIAGIIGTFGSFFTLIYIDTFIHMYPFDESIYPIRFIIGPAAFLLGGYGAGIAAEKLLHTVCRKKATSTLAVMTSALLTAYPVFYGWIMRAASALAG